MVKDDKVFPADEKTDLDFYDPEPSRPVTDLQQILWSQRQHCVMPVYWSASQILSNHSSTELHYTQLSPSISPTDQHSGYLGDSSETDLAEHHAPSDGKESPSDAGNRDSYKGFSISLTPPGLSRHPAYLPQRYLKTLVTPGEDEGYDSASREVDILTNSGNVTEV